jgi:hypothetical protein
MGRLAGGYALGNSSQEFCKRKIHSKLLGFFGIFPSSGVLENPERWEK